MELNKSIFKGLLILNVILSILLFGTNIGWFIYESQFEKVTTTTTTTGYSQEVENIDTVGDVIQNNN